MPVSLCRWIVEGPGGREAAMVDKERRSQAAQACEPYPGSFAARAVYTDKDRTVVVSGRCRCSQHGMEVFLDPEDPTGSEHAGTLRLRWTVDTYAVQGGSEPEPASVHEIFDVPETITAISIEGVGVVPIEEPAD